MPRSDNAFSSAPRTPLPLRRSLAGSLTCSGFLLFLLSPLAQSLTLTAAGGSTTGADNTGHDVCRLEANFALAPEIWSNDEWRVSLDHALGVVTFRDANTIVAVSWAPSLTLVASADESRLRPFVQAGFGVAYFSDDEFRSQGYRLWDGYKTSDMGSHGQFESSLAIGLMKDRFGLRLKMYHYSNAQLSSHNGGMNAAELGISYRL